MERKGEERGGKGRTGQERGEGKERRGEKKGGGGKNEIWGRRGIKKRIFAEGRSRRRKGRVDETRVEGTLCLVQTTPVGCA